MSSLCMPAAGDMPQTFEPYTGSYCGCVGTIKQALPSAPPPPKSLKRTKSEVEEYIQNGPHTPTAATCNLDPFRAIYEIMDPDLLWRPDQEQPSKDETIFALCNDTPFLLDRHSWEGLRHDVLAPMLQMTAKLLMSYDSKQYLYAAILSPLIDVDYSDPLTRITANVAMKTYQSIFRKGAPLTTDANSQIEKKLRELSAFVAFDVKELADGTRGECEAQEEVRTSSLCNEDGEPWRGTASNLYLSQSVYDELWQLYDSTPADADQATKDKLQVATFRCATIICHEFAHAIKNARFDDQEKSVDFEKQSFSEDEFDWESCVFGGIVKSTIYSYGAEINLTDYPSPAYFDLYMRTGGDGTFVATVPEQDVDNSWKVPSAWARSLWKEDEWERLCGPNALKMPKLLGYRSSLDVVVKCRIKCGRGAWDQDSFVAEMDSMYFAFGVEHLEQKPNSAAEKDVRASSLPSPEAGLPPLDADDMNDFCDRLEAMDEICNREGWSRWPFGNWDVRRHGASKDPATYGVPNGYISLLDGTLVAAHDANLLLQFEQMLLDKDLRKAEGLVTKLEGETQAGTDKEKIWRTALIGILGEMMCSEVPAIRRTVSGVEEVAFLIMDGEDDSDSDGDDCDSDEGDCDSDEGNEADGEDHASEVERDD